MMLLRSQHRQALTPAAAAILSPQPASRVSRDFHPYGQKIKTATKMTVVQASTMEQLSAPFPTVPHGSA
jgi:hypothetical protein